MTVYFNPWPSKLKFDILFKVTVYDFKKSLIFRKYTLKLNCNRFKIIWWSLNLVFIDSDQIFFLVWILARPKFFGLAQTAICPPQVFTVSVIICNICHFQFNHLMFSDQPWLQPFSQNESSINKTCVAVMNCKTLHFNKPIRSLAFVIQPTMSETPSIFKILYFSREFKERIIFEQNFFLKRKIDSWRSFEMSHSRKQSF